MLTRQSPKGGAFYICITFLRFYFHSADPRSLLGTSLPKIHTQFTKTAISIAVRATVQPIYYIPREKNKHFLESTGPSRILLAPARLTGPADVAKATDAFRGFSRRLLEHQKAADFKISNRSISPVAIPVTPHRDSDVLNMLEPQRPSPIAPKGGRPCEGRRAPGVRNTFVVFFRFFHLARLFWNHTWKIGHN